MPTERQREQCDACGFDSDLYNRADTISSQGFIGAVLEAAYEGLDDELLQRRPSPTTWSFAEYIDHVRETAFGNRFAMDVALGSPGTDLGAAPEPAFASEAATVDIGAAVAAVAHEFDEIQQLLQGLSDDQWSATVTVDGTPTPVGWFARHIVHDALHHMAEIGRIRHGFGQGAPTQVGRVAHLAASNGGVPKTSVQTCSISPAGVEGDAQADRRHHGRPIQALCLWGSDVLAQLQSEGHPIEPGNAGENITIEGVDWATLRPGARLQVGDIPLLVTAHAIPCAKNAQWFHDRDFKRILHDRHPGSSRLYAIPLAAGDATVGDRVTIEPAD